jgi:hypothetical protein
MLAATVLRSELETAERTLALVYLAIGGTPGLQSCAAAVPHRRSALAPLAGLYASLETQDIRVKSIESTTEVLILSRCGIAERDSWHTIALSPGRSFSGEPQLRRRAAGSVCFV